MNTSATAPIVIGIDATPGASAALSWAADVARTQHRPLRLIHAYTWPPFTPAEAHYPAPDEPDLRQNAEQLLAEALTAGRQASPDLDLSGEVIEGSAAAVLLSEAAGAAMLVIGTRGHGKLTGLLLGSVGMQVSSHASCPVTVVRPRHGRGPDVGRVVVGVDGSALSNAAVELAFEEASGRGVGLTAVHAWEVPDTAALTPARYDFERVASDQEQLLAEALAGHQRDFPELDVRRRAVRGDPARTLIDASQGAALTVVGSRGRGGFRGLLLGSVGHALLHHAGSPITVVRNVER